MNKEENFEKKELYQKKKEYILLVRKEDMIMKSTIILLAKIGMVTTCVVSAPVVINQMITMEAPIASRKVDVEEQPNEISIANPTEDLKDTIVFQKEEILKATTPIQENQTKSQNVSTMDKPKQTKDEEKEETCVTPTIEEQPKEEVKAPSEDTTPVPEKEVVAPITENKEEKTSSKQPENCPLTPSTEVQPEKETPEVSTETKPQVEPEEVEEPKESVEKSEKIEDSKEEVPEKEESTPSEEQTPSISQAEEVEEPQENEKESEKIEDSKEEVPEKEESTPSEEEQAPSTSQPEEVEEPKESEEKSEENTQKVEDTPKEETNQPTMDESQSQEQEIIPEFKQGIIPEMVLKEETSDINKLANAYTRTQHARSLEFQFQSSQTRFDVKYNKDQNAKWIYGYDLTYYSEEYLEGKQAYEEPNSHYPRAPRPQERWGRKIPKGTENSEEISWEQMPRLYSSFGVIAIGYINKAKEVLEVSTKEDHLTYYTFTVDKEDANVFGENYYRINDMFSKDIVVVAALDENGYVRKLDAVWDQDVLNNLSHFEEHVTIDHIEDTILTRPKQIQF